MTTPLDHLEKTSKRVHKLREKLAAEPWAKAQLVTRPPGITRRQFVTWRNQLIQAEQEQKRLLLQLTSQA